MSITVLVCPPVRKLNTFDVLIVDAILLPNELLAPMEPPPPIEGPPKNLYPLLNALDTPPRPLSSLRPIIAAMTVLKLSAKTLNIFFATPKMSPTRPMLFCRNVKILDTPFSIPGQTPLRASLKFAPIPKTLRCICGSTFWKDLAASAVIAVLIPSTVSCMDVNDMACDLTKSSSDILDIDII